jgi:hypothetical protein
MNALVPLPASRRAVPGAVLATLAPLPALAVADPVYAAMARHRHAYDVFMDVSALYDRAKTEETAAAELQRFRELESAERETFHALLATRPTTKAGAIACVEHVADCGLATDEMRTWLAMLVESPLVS